MLDPADVPAMRALAHRMLDDALDGVLRAGEGPAWRPIPADVKAALAQPLPREPEALDAVYDEYRSRIEPYGVGNRHPRFFGWVHGSGTVGGVLAEMLAAALNANTGGREHAAVYVERAVVAWCTELFGFPPQTGGILTSGTSLANLIAILCARRQAAGAEVRSAGIGARNLVGYASTAVHASVPAAFDIAGLGATNLRRIATDRAQRIELAALRAAIAADRALGSQPFVVIATAGTVDTGSVDDLAALADLCAAERLWLHVDGAFGALAVMSPDHAPLLRGIERADSLAFDFHKWLHVPYDAGAVLVRDGDVQRATFATSAAYLAPAAAGTAGGQPWFADFGPELSRRFRALAIWFAFKEHGVRRLGAAIAANCRQAARLAALAQARTELVVAAPVSLNIVCLRFVDPALDAGRADGINAAIAIDLQQRGIAVPSTTIVDGRTVLRFNFTNHRVRDEDLAPLLDAVLAAGRRSMGGQA